MKKLLFVCVVGIIAISFSCKKDAIEKKVSSKPKTVEATKTTVAASPAAYDYQKAIMAKRTLNPDLSK